MGMKLYPVVLTESIISCDYDILKTTTYNSSLDFERRTVDL